jgi:hypothetical protein
MVSRSEIIGKRVTIDIKDAGFMVNNIKTITFREGDSYIHLDLSDENYNELGQKMFPQGLIPDGFHEKIDLLNQLIEELEYIEDRENKGFYLKKVSYDEETDNIYFDC